MFQHCQMLVCSSLSTGVQCFVHCKTDCFDFCGVKLSNRRASDRMRMKQKKKNCTSRNFYLAPATKTRPNQTISQFCQLSKRLSIYILTGIHSSIESFSWSRRQVSTKPLRDQQKNIEKTTHTHTHTERVGTKLEKETKKLNEHEQPEV